MVIYIVIFVITLFSCFVRRNIIVFISLYMLLLAISAFRDLEVGTDTMNYYQLYHDIEGGFISSYMEKGWVFLNKLCASFGWGFRGVIMISSVLTLTPIFIRAWKSFKKPCLVILFYLTFFYTSSFNITRQMIAFSIVFFAFSYLIKKENIKYIYCILFALLFHYTALICLVFPLLIKLKNISISVIILFLLISYISGLYLIPLIITYIPMAGKYIVYIVSGEASSSFNRIMMNAFFIFLFIYSSHTNLKNFFLFYFVGLLVYNFAALSPAIGRIAHYFMVSQLYLFTMISSSYKVNRVILNFLTIIYGAIQYFFLLSVGVGECIPYNFMS